MKWRRKYEQQGDRRCRACCVPETRWRFGGIANVVWVPLLFLLLYLKRRRAARKYDGQNGWQYTIQIFAHLALALLFGRYIQGNVFAVLHLSELNYRFPQVLNRVVFVNLRDDFVKKTNTLILLG